jgi:ketosteroid isomerase-like protein
MPTRILNTLVFACVVLTANALGASKPAKLDASTREQLEQARSRYIKGVVRENASTLLMYHAAGARVMPEANPTIFGKANAQLYFQALFNRFDVQGYDKSPVHFIDMGSKIAEIGDFDLKMQKDRKERNLSGHYVNLWQKNEKGEWQIDTDVWTFKQWPPFKEELVFDGVPSVIMAMQAKVPIDSPRAFEIAAYEALNSHAVRIGDPALISFKFSDDAHYFPNFQPALIGNAAIAKWWQHHMKELPLLDAVHNRTNKLEVLDKFVIQHTSHYAAWRSGEHSGGSTGKHLKIWQRGDDGVLRAILFIAAYDS